VSELRQLITDESQKEVADARYPEVDALSDSPDNVCDFCSTTSDQRCSDQESQRLTGRVQDMEKLLSHVQSRILGLETLFQEQRLTALREAGQPQVSSSPSSTDAPTPPPHSTLSQDSSPAQAVPPQPVRVQQVPAQPVFAQPVEHSMLMNRQGSCRSFGTGGNDTDGGSAPQAEGAQWGLEFQMRLARLENIMLEILGGSTAPEGLYISKQDASHFDTQASMESQRDAALVSTRDPSMNALSGNLASTRSFAMSDCVMSQVELNTTSMSSNDELLSRETTVWWV